MSKASKASSKISPMTASLLLRVSMALIVGTLAACSTGPRTPPSASHEGPERAFPPGRGGHRPVGPCQATVPKSRWLPVRWAELPGFQADALHEAWNAWLRSCERPPAALAALCNDVRRLSIASEAERSYWLQQHLQPYRIESLDGKSQGMLTSYYEPEMVGSRVRTDAFEHSAVQAASGFWGEKAVVHAPADRYLARGAGRAGWA